MITSYLSADDIRYQLANLKQITFEVTDACNLNCGYCIYGDLYNDYGKRENKSLGVDKAKTLIDYLSALWTSEWNMSKDRNVYISFYGGEPLLNMPFIESVVDYMEKLEHPNRSFTFSMTTNGLLLDRYMDYLVEHRFNLLVSLDGNEHNSSYRVKGNGMPAYEEITRNVDLLKERYPDYFEQNVNFNAVLHNRNSISEIYGFFKAKYGKIASIGELNGTGVRPGKMDLFKNTYRNTKESLYQAENYEAIERDMFFKSVTYQSATTFVHRYSGFVFRDYTDLLLGTPPKKVPTGTCIPFSRRLFLTVDGHVLPCERIRHQFALGEVKGSEVDIDLEAIADKYNSYFSKMDRLCGKCHNSNACMQCVFNLSDIEDRSPVCHGFMDEKTFEKYKSSQMDFFRKNPREYYRIMENIIVE